MRAHTLLSCGSRFGGGGAAQRRWMGAGREGFVRGKFREKYHAATLGTAGRRLEESTGHMTTNHRYASLLYKPENLKIHDEMQADLDERGLAQAEVLSWYHIIRSQLTLVYMAGAMCALAFATLGIWILGSYRRAMKEGEMRARAAAEEKWEPSFEERQSWAKMLGEPR
eukprot:TRINITY_DN25923_c0_g1_i1.p1 TRINITY_DN25923_c0_g1~~TRINITY_DN25923_c0_g1_i1.p1  ORF type:complete len:186 (+),score=41.32 TRINITY_DN25923_c0_g1_i1:52-558(+)